MSEYIPQPSSSGWQIWANSLNRYLAQIRSKLKQKTANESATEDGIILWDRQNKYPVVSRDGEYVQIILEDGNVNLTKSTNITAAASNTGYAIQYDTPTGGNGITLDGTDPTKIVFAESGEYLLSFSAQIAASTASQIRLYFWARLNGTDVSRTTMVNTLDANTATIVVSRTAIFQINAGDYLQAMWATSDINGYLDATAATAFSPAAPSTTLAITRIHG